MFRKKKLKFLKLSQGLSMVEVVVASSIIATFIVSVAYSYSLILRLAFSNVASVKAVFLAEEGIEAVRFLKSSDWQTNILPLSADTDYFLDFTDGSWEINNESELIDGTFERKFVLEDVYRDASGLIVSEEQGSLDDGTKKLSVTVSWEKSSGVVTKTISTYIADI